MTEKPWFILLTEPNREVTATAGLIARRMQAYGPTVFKRVPSTRRVAEGQRKMLIEKQRPMFPGYIFVHLEQGSDDFGKPLKVAGVRDYLRFEGLPCSLPDALIRAIADREAAEYATYQESIGPKRRRAPFDVGAAVRVTDGPFADFIAQIEALDDKGRVTLLLSIFGRQTRTVVEGSHIEAA